MVQRADRRETLDRLSRLADGQPADDPVADVAAAVDWATDTTTARDITPPPLTHPRTARLRSIGRRLVPFVSGVCAVLVALALYQRLAPAAAPLTTTDVDQRVASALASQTPPPAYSQTVFDIIAPSMVLISTHGGPGTTPEVDAASRAPTPTPAPWAAASSSPRRDRCSRRSMSSGMPRTSRSPSSTARPRPRASSRPTQARTSRSSRRRPSPMSRPRRSWATPTCPSAATRMSWATPTASSGP